MLASALSNIAQAIILFSAGAFFVPEAVQVKVGFSKINAAAIFMSGLLILLVAVILAEKGEPR